MAISVINAKLSNVDYSIWIGTDFALGAMLLQSLKKLAPVELFVVTDSVVGPLYADKLERFLVEQGYRVEILTFQTGELHKTRKTKEWLEDQMLALGATRDCCIIALGGGIVMDVAGFLASTYARGVPLLLLPTSLLAMVDASVGGKTGVNTPQGKNLIGTIYQPQAVFIDSHFLQTLPQDELKNGLVEMIKHGLILDSGYVEYLQQNSQSLLARNLPVLVEAIYKSVEIKQRIVAEDAQESGKRRLLNFGHTVGHAIEAASGYTISHGRAVARGMLVEASISMQMGILKTSDFDRIKNILSIFEIDLSFEEVFTQEKFFEIMSMDKKSEKGSPRMVVLEKIGVCSNFNGAYCTTFEHAFLMASMVSLQPS